MRKRSDPSLLPIIRIPVIREHHFSSCETKPKSTFKSKLFSVAQFLMHVFFSKTTQLFVHKMEIPLPLFLDTDQFYFDTRKI